MILVAYLPRFQGSHVDYARWRQRRLFSRIALVDTTIRKLTFL